MKHSIIPYMPTVFLPVSDLKRSIEWYCELFEKNPGILMRRGSMYLVKAHKMSPRLKRDGGSPVLPFMITIVMD
jgi:hypothetical protein